jgi:hypothetical protein
MARRSEIADALLLIPALVLAAGAVFVLGWAVIWLGNRLVYLVYDLARAAGLPLPIALTLAVFGSALGVYGLYWALFERR